MNGDIRLFADTDLDAGRTLTIALGVGEGGPLSFRAGRLRLDGLEVRPGATVLRPAAVGTRRAVIEAVAPARIRRVVHGPGVRPRAAAGPEARLRRAPGGAATQDTPGAMAYHQRNAAQER